MRIPLNSGAYTTQSLIADAQSCENLYPEINPEETDPAAPMTHYPRPGLRPLGAPPAVAPGRGVFQTSNGNLYAVVGNDVFFVDRNYTFTRLGQITNRSTPVSMVDNGNDIVVVDGSPSGYTITLSNNTWNGAIVDPTGLFNGATRVDVTDTFLTFNLPGTNEWYISLSGQVAFNGLNLAAKSSYPDPIVTLAVNLRQVWLLGSQSSEVWYNSGAADFTFEEWPNVFIPYGCVAPYSLAKADINLFWLTKNLQGDRLIVRNEGYGVIAVSTRALEAEFKTYARVDDAIAFSYQQSGHTFYCISFPTADKTWCYDLSSKQWHRQTWIDGNGRKHRSRVSFGCFAYGLNIGQDWQTGELYALDPKVYTDKGQPIVFVRSFPHVVGELKEITHMSFVADFETGGIVGTGEASIGNPWSPGFSPGFGPSAIGAQQEQIQSPKLSMRYSNDGGNTWSNSRQKALISAGNYRSMMRWRGLGMARDRIYELSWSYNGPSALQGAYIEPIGHGA